MEEIDLKELFDYFKSKLFLFAIIVSIVFIIGCLYFIFLQKPLYGSYTTIVLGGNSESSITSSDLTLSKNLLGTYTEIVKSRRVLDKVNSDLGLNISYSTLSSYLSVSSINDTEIIKISVKTDDSYKSMMVANYTAKYFIEEVKRLYNIDNANTLDEAIINSEAVNINIVKQFIIYLLVGMIISFLLIFVMFYFDRTIKSIEQIEIKTGLPILGKVYNKGGNK